MDVYALGTALYEMLTGRPPFLAASAADTLRQVADRSQAPPRPCSLNRRVSPALEAICLKCLEKEPTNRYASAVTSPEDLSRFLGGKRVQAPLWTWTRPVRQWARHNPLPASLALGLGLVFLVATPWLYTLYRAEAAARFEADERTKESIQARNLAQHRLYVQTLQRADRLGIGRAGSRLRSAARSDPLSAGVAWRRVGRC